MNFKLTTWKSIVSIIVGLVISLFFSYTIYTGSSKTGLEFNSGSIIGFVGGLIIVYIIWGLIQKK